MQSAKRVQVQYCTTVPLYLAVSVKSREWIGRITKSCLFLFKLFPSRILHTVWDNSVHLRAYAGARADFDGRAVSLWAAGSRGSVLIYFLILEALCSTAPQRVIGPFLGQYEDGHHWPVLDSFFLSAMRCRPSTISFSHHRCGCWLVMDEKGRVPWGRPMGLCKPEQIADS